MQTMAPGLQPNPWTVAAAGHTKNSPYDQRSVIAEHVNSLPPDAPLRALHASQAFDGLIKSYEAADASALKAQGRYKFWGWIALMLTTAATLVSATMLIPVSDWLPSAAKTWVGRFQLAAVVVTFAIVWALKKHGAIDKWITSRAEAERLRGAIFYDLVAAPVPEGLDANRLLSEKLELLQAAHVEYQRSFYKSGVTRHSNQSWHQNLPGRTARLLAAFAIALSIVSSFGWWPRFFSSVLEWLLVISQTNRW